jgi:hypothetical protein
MDEMMLALKRRSETGIDPFGMAPAIFERVIAGHLTSSRGIEWMQRSSKVSDSRSKTTAASPPTTLPLVVKLNEVLEGAVPTHADMKPGVLYKSLNPIFPFCDLLYKEATPVGKLICIQVSLEATGTRAVTAGAFKKFCERMGWGERPSKAQVGLIEYVYCPDPAVAHKAQVAFEEGVGIDVYTVWHVNEDFSSCSESS